MFEFLDKYYFYYCEAYIYYQVLFIQAFNSSHCTWHLFLGQKSEVAGWKGDFGNWITKIFLKVSAQSLLLPCILHRSRLTWADWTVLSDSWILHIKTFNVVFIFISCCARAREKCVLRSPWIEWVQFGVVRSFCEKLQNYRYGNLPKITDTLMIRRLQFIGHCWRKKDEVISELLLWEPKHGARKRGRPATTYVDQLRNDTGLSIAELKSIMGNRKEWMKLVNGVRVRSK